MVGYAVRTLLLFVNVLTLSLPFVNALTLSFEGPMQGFSVPQVSAG